MWSWFGKNTTYRLGKLACAFTVFEKLAAAYLYRMRISRVRACIDVYSTIMYTHELMHEPLSTAFREKQVNKPIIMLMSIGLPRTDPVRFPLREGIRG